MQFKVGWPDLKAFAAQRGTPVQWIVIDGAYNIAAIDGAMEVVCTIPITNPAQTWSEQADFELNFKANGNASPRGNVVQVLGKDELTLCPFGAINLDMTPNDLTVWDIPLPATCVLRGGTLFSPNAAMGDWISVQVVDKDNVVGAGGTPDDPTILGIYVLSWYIMPGVDNKLEDVSISETLPQGVYVRINYTSVSSTAPQVIMNFLSYVGA